MIRGTDGLDYQDLTERLLGRPADTPRNQAIRSRRGLRLPIDALLALPADATRNQVSECLSAHLTAYLADKLAGKSATHVIVDDLPT